MKGPNKWIVFADEDWLMARQALQSEVFNQVCFHAQQGVEKLLKGFLHDRRQRIPKIHSLGELLAICVSIDSSLQDFAERCRLLDRYYIPTRYPDALPGTLPDGLPNKTDATEALAILDEIRTRVVK